MLGRLRWSADGIARALDATIARTVPSVRTRTGMPPLQIALDLRSFGDGAAQETVAAIDQLTRWVYPMALGTTPARMAYIRSIVGTQSRADYGGHPTPVDRPSSDEPSVADLRQASSLVSRIILRLWAMDGLAVGRGDDQIATLAQRFLSDPYGIAAHLPADKPVRAEPPDLDH